MDNDKKVKQVTKEVKNVAKKAETVVNAVDSANLALTEMRLQFDTLSEIQKEERIEYQKMHNESIKEIMDRHDKDIKHWKHICMALILTLTLFIGGIAGGVIYFLSNYDIAFGYTQNAYNEVGGDNIINDGIHFNDGFHNSDK